MMFSSYPSTITFFKTDDNFYMVSNCRGGILRDCRDGRKTRTSIESSMTERLYDRISFTRIWYGNHTLQSHRTFSTVFILFLYATDDHQTTFHHLFLRTSMPKVHDIEIVKSGIVVVAYPEISYI
jgi:hypothetical protein